MKKLMVILSLFLLSSQFAFAQKRACEKAEFDLLVAVAANGGYEWNGTSATCTADEFTGGAIYWAAPAAGGVMGASLSSNPYKLQFTSGGSINLFCSMVINGIWQSTGEKKCP
jgi:hypothetical protein